MFIAIALGIWLLVIIFGIYLTYTNEEFSE